MSQHSIDTAHAFPPLSNLQRLAISESGFVFDPVSGHNFTVNETGLTVLRLLQKGISLQPMLENLMNDYEVSIRDAERDVLEFASVLRDYVGD